jgi:hypothetical protein
VFLAAEGPPHNPYRRHPVIGGEIARQRSSACRKSAEPGLRHPSGFLVGEEAFDEQS